MLAKQGEPPQRAKYAVSVVACGAESTTEKQIRCDSPEFSQAPTFPMSDRSVNTATVSSRTGGILLQATERRRSGDECRAGVTPDRAPEALRLRTGQEFGDLRGGLGHREERREMAAAKQAR